LEFGICVARAVLEDVVAHARGALPGEACGLLLGGDRAIVESVRATNIAEDPTRRFEIDPRDHIAARRDARSRGLAVLGFYHSHPRSSAEPSATDLAEANYPDHLYLIVSLAAAAPDLRLFRLESGNFQTTAFVTVG
jgi:proteasome lid subunit RPN8/RPN11